MNDKSPTQSEQFGVPDELIDEFGAVVEALQEFVWKLAWNMVGGLEAHKAQVEYVEATTCDWSMPTFGPCEDADDVLYNIAELRSQTGSLAALSPELKAALKAADRQVELRSGEDQARLDAMTDAELLDEARRLAEEP